MVRLHSSVTLFRLQVAAIGKTPAAVRFLREPRPIGERTILRRAVYEFCIALSQSPDKRGIIGRIVPNYSAFRKRNPLEPEKRPLRLKIASVFVRSDHIACINGWLQRLVRSSSSCTDFHAQSSNPSNLHVGKSRQLLKKGARASVALIRSRSAMFIL
jgi:hypothetical protein